MPKEPSPGIFNNIDAIFTQRFDRIKKSFKVGLDKVFDSTYNNAVKVGVDLGAAKAAKANIKRKIKVVTDIMSGRIDTIKDVQSKKVANTISNAFAQGLPSLALKQQVAQKIGASNNRLDGAIRTNTAQLSSYTKLITWDEMGFTKCSWVLGINDGVTRPFHKFLHKKVFLIKDALSGNAPIPGRVNNKDGTINLAQSMNCRCSLRLEDNNAKVTLK